MEKERAKDPEEITDMKKLRILIFGIIGCIIGAGQSASAQFYISPSVQAMSDDNIDNNRYNVYDIVTEYSLDAGYGIEKGSSAFNVYYLGAYYAFNRYSDRRFVQQGAGLQYGYAPDDGERELNLSTYYALRINRPEYSALDYGLYHLSADLSLPLGEASRIMFGYRFRLLSYENISELSNTENFGYVRAQYTLPTKTTLFAEGALGLKSYINAADYLATDTTAAYGMGRRRMGAIGNPGVAQMSGSVKIAQSLGDLTGISASVRIQSNLTKETRYFADGYVVSDDEIFDSRYAYEGTLTSMSLTRLLPWNVKAVLSASYETKKYSDFAAFDYTDTQIAANRYDYRSIGSVLFQKEFEEEEFFGGFALGVRYEFINNVSNDYYYDYTNGVWSVQLGYYF